MEHQILGGHTVGEAPITSMRRTFSLFMARLWLARTSCTWLVPIPKAMAPGAIGGGVGVAAGHGHSRLGQAQLRCNHMHDALATASQAIEHNAVLSAVSLQGAEHLLSQGICTGRCCEMVGTM